MWGVYDDKSKFVQLYWLQLCIFPIKINFEKPIFVESGNIGCDRPHADMIF